jgi:putative transposase
MPYHISYRTDQWHPYQARRAIAGQWQIVHQDLGDDRRLAVELHRTANGTVSITDARIEERRLCARKKGSHRRSKMARSVAQTHLKTERQRRDFHFKTAKRYADAHSTIVVEDLNIQALARSRLAKSILDASWGAFLFILTYKAASAGGQVIRVDPRYTTQKCSKCGELVEKSLSVRTHTCPHCGYVADRDVNAARNILQAGAPPSGTLAAGLAGERGALWAKPPALAARSCHMTSIQMAPAIKPV